MAITLGELELYPGYENIGVRSHFSGEDEHIAVLSFRRSGGAWIPSIDMETDLRESLRRNQTDSQWNPYNHQNRAVVFFLEPSVAYDVRVQYFDAGGGLIGDHIGSVVTLDDDPPSTGNNYYVSPSGNDAADGSEAAPWRTITHAAGQVLPSDTVWVLPGTYPEGQVLINRSGQIDNYITFRGTVPDNKPIITGAERGVFRIEESSYIRIKDFDIRNTWDEHGIAVAVFGNCRGCIIEDNIITTQGVGWWCSALCVNASGYPQGPSDTLFQRNICTSLVNGNNGPFGVLSYGADGIGCRGTVIRYNEFHGGYYDIIGSGGNFIEEGGIYQDSHIHDNLTTGCMDDVFELEGGGLNCSCWGNTSRDFGVFGCALASVIVGPLYVFRNIWDATTNANGCFKLGANSDGVVNVYHNTVRARNAVLANYAGPRPYRNVRFFNNIIWPTGGNGYCVEDMDTDGATKILDYNCMFAIRSTPIKWLDVIQTWEDWRASSGLEAHGISRDPMLMDYVNGDYRLQPSSPCIDAGVIIKGFNDVNSPWPYQGGAPDIGAIESGVVGPPFAAFTAEPDNGEAPLIVQFINNSLGAIDTHLWDFGDGSTSSEANPIHTYNQGGQFEVSLTVTGPGGSNTAVMTIEVIQTYTLQLTASEGGTTAPEPGVYQYSGSVTLTALPDSDYRFSHWEENGVNISSEYTLEIFMDTNRNIEAVFEYVEPPPGQYVVTIISLGEGYTIPSGEVVVTEGETLQIAATALAGYKFDHWEGDVSGKDNPISFAVNSNMSVIAVFSERIITPVLAVTSLAVVLSTISILQRRKQ